jgi:hypothetical protein
MLEIWCEIVCAQCAKADIGQFAKTDRIPRRNLKERAERAGWKFYKDEAFCSDDCLTETYPENK